MKEETVNRVKKAYKVKLDSQLARKTGVSRQAVFKWRKNGVSYKVLLKCAMETKTSLESLILEEHSK